MHGVTCDTFKTDTWIQNKNNNAIQKKKQKKIAHILL